MSEKAPVVSVETEAAVATFAPTHVTAPPPAAASLHDAARAEAAAKMLVTASPSLVSATVGDARRAAAHPLPLTATPDETSNAPQPATSTDDDAA